MVCDHWADMDVRGEGFLALSVRWLESHRSSCRIVRVIGQIRPIGLIVGLGEGDVRGEGILALFLRWLESHRPSCRIVRVIGQIRPISLIVGLREGGVRGEGILALSVPMGSVRG